MHYYGCLPDGSCYKDCDCPCHDPKDAILYDEQEVKYTNHGFVAMVNATLVTIGFKPRQFYLGHN